MQNLTKIGRLDQIVLAPRRGKIHLGIKAKSLRTGREYPKETDYFVCPPEVQAIYEKEPKELKIALHSENIEDIIPYAYKWWKSSAGLHCKGNGIIAYRATAILGEFEEIECKGEGCPHFQKQENKPPDCRISANLQVILPEISTIGVYQIDTGSFHSIVNIINALRNIKTMFGRLTNLYDPATLKPLLTLKRSPKETHGSGRKETHYTMNIEMNLSNVQLLEMREGLQNPLLIGSTPSRKPPNMSQEEWRQQVNKEIDDLYDGNNSTVVPVNVEITSQEEAKTPEKSKPEKKKRERPAKTSGTHTPAGNVGNNATPPQNDEFSETTKLHKKIQLYAKHVVALNPMYGATWLSNLCQTYGGEGIGQVEEIITISNLEELLEAVERKGRELAAALARTQKEKSNETD